MTKGVDYSIDPSDGLRVAEVGDWSEEKHLRLKHYVDITRDTRRKFDHNGCSYTDLYCGPGRARLRDSGKIVDGSPLVAAIEAQKAVPFTQLHIGDLDRQNVEACCKRLAAKSIDGVSAYVGEAAETAEQVVRSLNPYGLHIAFLDPFSIAALPFEVIRTLAQVKRMDLIIHVSTMDLQRNVKRDLESGALGRFAPGCTEVVDRRQRNEILVREVFRHWRKLISDLDFKMSDNIERIAGTKNQPLYWLVLASRHNLARKFWAAVSNVGPQGRLFGDSL